MNYQCVALEEQRSWRDLRRLEQSVSGVRWVGADEVAAAPEPLVACGLWASREPSAPQVLRSRAKAGLATLLVARFEPVDMGPILGAVASIQVCPGETSALAWEDGQRFEVPGVTVIDTPLPEGHWARSTAGTTVLGFRQHTEAGLIVLCTATVAGVALGTDPTQQRAMLQCILDEMARRAFLRVVADPAQSGPDVCATAAEYLEHFGPDGALVLLAALNAQAGRVNGETLAAIGATLPEARLATLAAALPDADSHEIEQALRAAGWGSHLRILSRRRLEAS